jgi:heme/copper-type cytochrome/quinol oxidase subunit 4
MSTDKEADLRGAQEAGDPTRPEPLPQPPETLNYQAPSHDQPEHGPIRQIWLGFFSWGVGAVFFGMILGSRPSAQVILVYMALILLVQIALGVHMFWKGREKLFPVGQIIGLSLTCLLPIGLVGVACGGWLK